MMLFYQPILFTGLFQMVISGGTNYEPYRWIISYQKPATLSSTEGELKASFATDGNFRILYDADPGTNYSASLKEQTPSLQIDLGKSVPVQTVQLNAPKYQGSKAQSRIIVRVGDNPAAGSTENPKCSGMYCICSPPWVRLQCGKKGRYVNIIRDFQSTVLHIAEAAVFKRPVENLAYKKKTADSGAHSSTYDGDKIVDMQDNTLFVSKFSPPNWIRVDLEDSHLIHEVLLYARDKCCTDHIDALYGFELRIGDSLANDGNLNPLCGEYDLETGEIRSFYCDMFGRYVNIIRAGLMYLAEVIVNPETTENVAALADVTSDVDAQGGKSLTSIVDTLRYSYFTPWTTQKDLTKRITISLGSAYNVAMILIANTVKYLNELIDFKIAVGMTDAFGDSTLCVPGVQDMAGILVKSFYCTPDRIPGNHVFIDQGAGKQIGISEVGVYEETKPKIVDHRTNRFIWSKDGGEVTLECDAKGYPAPVISWVQDKVVIKTGSTSLQLTNLKLNDSKVIECWANNSNGFEGRLFALEITSELRMCVKNRELRFQTGQSQTVGNHELQGNMFYRFTDAQKHSDLQFHETSPPNTNPSCKTWLKEKHPSVHDGVVSQQLCVRDQGNDCHSVLDIYVRRCTHYYVYNFKDLRDLSQLKPCMKSAVNLQHGLRPLMTSSTRKHALSEKTFHTEENFQESYECLVLCQLDKRCKSFNFSKKLQLCELNSGTKKEFPGNLVPHKDFDHYHINRGSMKQEL